MNRARPCLAGAAALALTVAAIALPAPVAAGPNPLRDPLERDPTSPYAHTAIGAVFDANGGRVPATGAELVATLAQLGDFVQLAVPFSAVSPDASLGHPRVVITMRPSSHPRRRDQSGGWEGWEPSPEPLNQIEANRTQLEGRLFLAANTASGAFGLPEVRSVEFISWNGRKQRFDFGIIEGMGNQPEAPELNGKPEVRVLDGTRCFSCHKNRGPILGVGPWSNTTHNTVVRDAAKESLPYLPSTRPDLLDGMDLLRPHAAEVDAAVRQGADLLRDRAVFKHLAATLEGRKALVLLFDAILTPGSLGRHDTQIKKELDRTAPLSFVRDAQAVRSTALPSALRDFNLPEPVRRGEVWRGRDRVIGDGRRFAREVPLSAAHVPSNPKAFVRFPPRPVRQPSDAVSAALLARTIGLTEPDRVFLAETLDETVERLDHPALTRAGVAGLIFNGPAFADLMTTGVLPDRDDFKDRFVAGAAALLKARRRDDFLAPDRDAYTSAPKIDPRAEPDNEPTPLPSHACLGCHDIRTAGKSAFSPIPMLAFDPFDATARAAWVKSSDRTRKAEVLGRMLKRLATDKDMPPEDSTEYELYRQKNPTGLAAVKNWLDAELRKAK
jgi:hypothetical protein